MPLQTSKELKQQQKIAFFFFDFCIIIFL